MIAAKLNDAAAKAVSQRRRRLGLASKIVKANSDFGFGIENIYPEPSESDERNIGRGGRAGNWILEASRVARKPAK